MADPNSILKDLCTVVVREMNGIKPTIVPRLCHTIPNDGAYEKFVFPTNLPQPTPFIGSRQSVRVDVNNVYNLKAEEYELTLDFPLTEIEDTRIFKEDYLIAEGVRKGMMFEDIQCSKLIESGADVGNIAYDGNIFYGDTHLFGNAGANNIDNKMAGTGTTFDQTAADISAGISALKLFKDNSGTVLNNPDPKGAGIVAHFHPSREATVARFLNSVMLPNEEGGLVSMADPLPDGNLTDPDDMYLHVTKSGSKPFVLIDRDLGLRQEQERNKLPLTGIENGAGTLWEVAVFGPGSDFAVNTGKVRIALRRRFKIGYLLFYRSLKISN